VYSGSNLGGLIVSLLGAWWLVEYGWRSTYLFVGLGTVALLLPVSWALIREPPAEFVPLESESVYPVDRIRAGASEEITFSEMIRSRDFWVLGVALFIFFFYYIGVTSNFVLFLTDQGVSIGRASASFGVTVFLGVTSKIGIGVLADRWPAKTALLVNFSLVALASFLLLGIPRMGMLPLFILVHGVSTAAQNVVYPMIVAERFGTQNMAKIYGALMVALLPGGVLGPIFAGYLFDIRGSYDLAFQIFAGLNLVGLTALFSVRGRKRLPAGNS
jgi:MFS family permease